MLSDLMSLWSCTHMLTWFHYPLQMHGSNVAPFTLGKQNLLLHTLRQLEKHFFVDHQTFRLGRCSHNEGSQEANATVIIVQNTESDNVGLEMVRAVVTVTVT